MESILDNTFILQRLYNNSRIPIFIYNEDMQFIKAVPISKQEINPFLNDETILFAIRDCLNEKRLPIIFMENFNIYFGALLDKNNNYYIWGPISNEKLTNYQTTSYKMTHGINNQNFYIEVSTFELVTNILSIAYYFHTGEELLEHEIKIEWGKDDGKYAVSEEDIEKYQLDKSEFKFQYNSYNFEHELLDAVETGNVEEMQRLMQVNKNAIQGVGKLAENDKKQMEYMCVSSVALITRAAMRGHMNPGETYELADIYLQKIEKCKTVEELARVGSAVQFDFTQKVKECQEKQRGAVYIEQCKDYIAKHLRSPFKIRDMAKIIGINQTYLSRKFSEQEGITIQQYINRERCYRAANMMKYTDYGIAEIAEYFCYSSQSHFGKQFKIVYGVTPYEYRKTNRYIESFDKPI